MRLVLHGRHAQAIIAGLVLAHHVGQTLAYTSTFNPNSKDSVQAATKQAITGMLKFYDGDKPGGTPGRFPGIYWWQAGAAWNTLIDYYKYTGDASYNKLVTDSILHQAGDQRDFMQPNVTLQLGNDDHVFWGFTAIGAAETQFPDPPADQPQWLALAQATFNRITSRWDMSTCDGGLRWQVYSFNKGWNYKNSISNGGLFHLAARLARYTGDQTYIDWADKIYDWMLAREYINEADWSVYDGGDVPECKILAQEEWSYNNAMMLSGSAFLASHTQSSKWHQRFQGFLSAAEQKFTSNGIFYEPNCEPYSRCDNDQTAFKGFLAQYLGYCMELIPSSAPKIKQLLSNTAIGLSKTCASSGAVKACGMIWTTGTYDGRDDFGTALTAFNTFNALLAPVGKAPATADNGGTSKGNADAGLDRFDLDDEVVTPPTVADKAGAGILTFLVLAWMCSCMCWLIV